MRTERVKTTDGETVEMLVPETEADVRRLRERMRKRRGQPIDDRLSLGDGRPKEPTPNNPAPVRVF
jgi:hypothetical protein